jgi:Na+-translocating ferredoxin:NAD+ oxidoreductase RnfC subunit
MAKNETNLITPEMKAGTWSIDWLVGDKTNVEVGDPLAVVERDGERLLAFSPVSGTIDIIMKSPFTIKAIAVVLAKVMIEQVQSKKGKNIMDDEQKVYMEKMDKLIKSAIKSDFDEVKNSLRNVKQQISSIQNGISDIKKHLGIK